MQKNLVKKNQNTKAQGKNISGKNDETGKKKTHKSNKKIEEEKQAIAEWKQLLVNDCDNQPYAAMIVTKDSVIEYANDRCEGIFKYAKEDLVNGDVNMLVPPQFRNTHYEQVKSFFKKGILDLIEDNFAGYSKADKELQLVIGTLLKKFTINDIQLSLALCQIREVEKDTDDWMIMPENPFYIGWISFMFIFIIGSMLYLPYDFVFVQSEDNKFLNQSIQILTIMDIIFNFNCAYIEKDDVITDRTQVTYNQLATQFVIDLQTGIPVELLQGFLSRDLLTVFKLLRALKLVKQQNALTNDQMITLLSKNEVFKNFKMISNKQQLYQEFFLILLSLLIINHYIASIWVLCSKIFDQNLSTWVKNSGVVTGKLQTLSQIGDQLFVQDQTNQRFEPQDQEKHQGFDSLNQVKRNPGKVQVDVQLEMMSSFLGYKRIEAFNEFEYELSFLIMYCGLFFIAQTIGRMSMLLTETFKDNQLQSRIQQVVYSVMGETDLSNKTLDTLLKDLKDNYDLFFELKHTQLESKIPPNLFTSLQLEQYSTLISTHRLFKFIPLKFIEKLHRYCKYESNTKMYEIGTVPSNIFLIVKGKVIKQDSTDTVKQDYEYNEIVGFSEFQLQLMKNLNMKVTLREDEGDGKKTKKGADKDANLKKQQNYNNKYEHQANAEPGTTYITLSFLILEEIIKNDISFQQKLEDQVNKESMNVTPLEINQTKAEMESFDNKNQVGIIFLNTGQIYKLNKEFKSIFTKEEADFENYSIFDIVKPVEKTNKVVDVFGFKPGKHVLHLFGKKIETDISISYKQIVISKKRIYNKKSSIISLRNDTLFIYFNMVNSIEAFLVNKQKAVMQVSNLLSYEVGKLQGTNQEDKKFNQGLMRDELKGQKMDQLEFKQFLNNLNLRKQHQKKRTNASPTKNLNGDNSEKKSTKLKRAPKITNKAVEQKQKEEAEKRKKLDEMMKLMEDNSKDDFEDDDDHELKMRLNKAMHEVNQEEIDCFI